MEFPAQKTPSLRLESEPRGTAGLIPGSPKGQLFAKVVGELEKVGWGSTGA